MVFDLKLLKFMYDETFIIKNRKMVLCVGFAGLQS
jgi:hypothetical protein